MSRDPVLGCCDGPCGRNYATGVRIAENSLPDDFGGVLGWGWIDNRPFLRCLHGMTLSTWRLDLGRSCG